MSKAGPNTLKCLILCPQFLVSFTASSEMLSQPDKLLPHARNIRNTITDYCKCKLFGRSDRLPSSPLQKLPNSNNSPVSFYFMLWKAFAFSLQIGSLRFYFRCEILKLHYVHKYYWMPSVLFYFYSSFCI